MTIVTDVKYKNNNKKIYYTNLLLSITKQWVEIYNSTFHDN